jgi:hypothetical protein
MATLANHNTNRTEMVDPFYGERKPQRREPVTIFPGFHRRQPGDPFDWRPQPR